MRMTKKRKHLKEAEKLYVERHLTLREIAGRLPVSYTTLRAWKQEEDWERKKKDRLLEAQAFHQELYSLGRELSAEIRRDMRAGVEIKPARYYALGRIMDIVEKTHKYEEKLLDRKKNAKKDVSIKDLVNALNDKLFASDA